MPGSAGRVTDWSVGGGEYGEFLVDVFAEWVRKDVGTAYVMNVEWALANFRRFPGAACHHQPLCGRCLVVEHDGSVYACDHYVYPEERRGVLGAKTLPAMVDAAEQWAFGEAKSKSLSSRCRNCDYVNGCWGGCPKHRFVEEDGELQNYLCAGYALFFRYVTPYMKAFDYLAKNGRPPGDISKVTVLAKR